MFPKVGLGWQCDNRKAKQLDTNNRDTMLYELEEKRLNRRSPREVEESSFLLQSLLNSQTFEKKKKKELEEDWPALKPVACS